MSNVEVKAFHFKSIENFGIQYWILDIHY